jgi:hypothetical protein
MEPSYVINHRAELDRLRPFLMERGGVVHVRAPADAPSSIFARTLRTAMDVEEWPKAWKHVQIEPSNANTHYVADILIQVAETCQLSLASAPSTGGSLSVVIGSEIDAGGSVEVSDIDVTVVGDPFESALRDRARTRDIASRLAEVLSEFRVALIFVGTHNTPPPILRAIRSELWDGAFASLVEKGLLLVDISDPAAMGVRSETWPPAADIAIDLPVALGDSARVDAARDIARIALAENLVASDREAMILGRTLVAGASTTIELHATLGRAVASWIDDVV